MYKFLSRKHTLPHLSPTRPPAGRAKPLNALYAHQKATFRPLTKGSRWLPLGQSSHPSQTFACELDVSSVPLLPFESSYLVISFADVRERGRQIMGPSASDTKGMSISGQGIPTLSPLTDGLEYPPTCPPPPSHRNPFLGSCL